MLTYRQYGDFIMSEEQKIFLPGTESATIVSQAMVMATRMELLDLLDYARKNKLDSISVEYLQDEITDLWKIDEKVYNAHEEDYLKAHSNSRYTPEDCRPENLRALCQRCHNKYDAQHRAETRKNNKK